MPDTYWHAYIFFHSNNEIQFTSICCSETFSIFHLLLGLIIAGFISIFMVVGRTAKVSSFLCCCFVLTEPSVPVPASSIRLSIFSVSSVVPAIVRTQRIVVITRVGPVVSVVTSLALLIVLSVIVVVRLVVGRESEEIVGVDGLISVEITPAAITLVALAMVNIGKDKASVLCCGVSVTTLGTLAAVGIVKGARLTVGNPIVVHWGSPSHDVSDFGNLSIAGIDKVLAFIHKSRVTGSWCGEVDVALLALQVVVIASGQTGLLDTADKQEGISSLATFQIGGVAGNVVFESVLLLCTGDAGTATGPRECRVGGGEQKEISRRGERRVNVGFSQQVAECSEFVVVGVGANNGDNIFIIIDLSIGADGVSSRWDHQRGECQQQSRRVFRHHD